MSAAPADRYDVSIAGFGNVDEAVARRLGRVLGERLGAIPAPVVRFAGLTVDGEDVVSPLAGEAEEMTDIARLVAKVAATMNLYVDRRRFRPALAIGSVAGAAGPVAAAAEAAAQWSGTLWEAAGVSLVRTRWANGVPCAEEFAFIELGHPLGHPVA